MSFDRESQCSRRNTYTPSITYKENNFGSDERELPIANDKREFENEINHDLDEYEENDGSVNQP